MSQGCSGLPVKLGQQAILCGMISMIC
uniref:Uncharacterized protein n=1 Tax=Anguilla anguilla TaxID=7936 RepID=A0A0E9R6E2_ANGAN